MADTRRCVVPVVVAAAVSAAALAGGCSSDVVGAAQSSHGAATASPTSAEPPTSPESPESHGPSQSAPQATATAGRPSGGADASCGADPRAPAISSALATLRSAQPSPYGWTYLGESDYDPCAALSYAIAETPGGTASSPMQLMLFHDGGYVGTGTLCALPYTTVTGTTSDAVHVEYRWPQDGDSNADPTGHAATTYRWTGAGVRMAPPLPSGMPNLHC